MEQTNNTNLDADRVSKEDANEAVDYTIPPEVAYVRSVDYLGKVLSEAALTERHLKTYQIACLIISVVIGILLAWKFGHIFGFLAPVVGLNATFLLYYSSVSKALNNTKAVAAYDLDRVKKGNVDPRVYYNEIRLALGDIKKADYIESLSADTSSLTSKEKAMLTKFRGER